MSVAAPRPKDPQPCGAYFGNVCTGFGGEAVCMTCGHDRAAHRRDDRDLDGPARTGPSRPATGS